MRIGRLITPILLLVAIAAVSCSHDDLPPRNEEASFPVVLNAHTYTHEAEGPSTRGASDLTDFYNDFYVRSFKTMDGGATQEVMPNYTVRFDTDKSEWKYDGLTSVSDAEQYLKFWDLSAKNYMFAAVSPLPDKTADNYGFKTTDVTIDANGKIDIKGIKGNMSSIGDKSGNSSKAPDWMVARTVRDFTTMEDQDAIANSQLSIVNSKFQDVPLMFHHIFARVDFLAYATKSLPVSKFKVYISDDTPDDNIINQGDYSTDGGWTNKKAATKEETGDQQDPKRLADYTYLTARTIGTDAEHPVMLCSHVQIPQEWLSPGRELKITIETTEKDDDDKPIIYTGTIILTPTNNGSNSWLENHHYTYILKIVADGDDSEVILFEVDMDEWKWKPGSEIEDPETDW